MSQVTHCQRRQVFQVSIMASDTKMFPDEIYSTINGIENLLVPSLKSDECKYYISKLNDTLRKIRSYEDNVYLSEKIRLMEVIGQQKDRLNEQKDRLNEQKEAQMNQKMDTLENIHKGTFLLSLRDVWGVDEVISEEALASVNLQQFNRNQHVSLGYGGESKRGWGSCYQITADGARDSKNDCFHSENYTRTQHFADVPIDIFGNISNGNESAHLMPDAHGCSTFWSFTAPWLLRLGEQFEQTSTELTEEIMQNCIHGFSTTGGTKESSSLNNNDVPVVQDQEKALHDTQKSSKSKKSGKSHQKEKKNTNTMQSKSKKSSLEGSLNEKEVIQRTGMVELGLGGQTSDLNQEIEIGLTKSMQEQSLNDTNDTGSCRQYPTEIAFLDQVQGIASDEQQTSVGESSFGDGCNDSGENTASMPKSVLSSSSRNVATQTVKSLGKRKDHSGIKHFPSNQIRLQEQRFFDANPCLLIIPIMSNEDITNWNGGGYSAIVLAAEHEKITPGEVYFKTGANIALPRDGTLATQADLNDAREALETTVLGLAKLSSQADYSDSCFTKSQQHSTNRDKVLHAVDSLKAKVPVPTQKKLEQSALYENAFIRVRKITFEDHIQGVDGHPAPDPRLLILKAATNWFKLHGLYLLPACGEDDKSTPSRYHSGDEGDDSDHDSRACSHDTQSEYPPIEIAVTHGTTFDLTLSDSDEFDEN